MKREVIEVIWNLVEREKQNDDDDDDNDNKINLVAISKYGIWVGCGKKNDEDDNEDDDGKQINK